MFVMCVALASLINGHLNLMCVRVCDFFMFRCNSFMVLPLFCNVVIVTMDFCLQ